MDKFEIAERNSKVKSFGYVNGWSEEPDEIVKCRELGHEMEYEKGAWNCTHNYTCYICNIRYSIDSGG